MLTCALLEITTTVNVFHNMFIITQSQKPSHSKFLLYGALITYVRILYAD